MGRTADEKDLTTARTYEHRNKERNNGSEADLPSLAMVSLVLASADIVVRGGSKANTCMEVVQYQSESECSFNPQAP